ncbi:MAG: type II toxin-antitoxin system Phd/YefM family antitoxin [Coriobacteriales bacterium]|nr:type II toxin-antitoxin system Phd/YefM family antitoxin [Coriobacteriales bacterium]
MKSVSMFEAKTNLSKYVASVVSQEEPYIVILRNNKPVAKITPYEEGTENRIGIAEGLLPSLSLDAFNTISLEEDFYGEGTLL